MCSNDPIPWRGGAATADGAEATSMYCRNEAVVKKMDPMKKVMLSGVTPTAVA